MLNTQKIARFYAKAILKHAIEKNSINYWLNILKIFSTLSSNNKFRYIINNKYYVTDNIKIDILTKEIKNSLFYTEIKNLIKLLIYNKKMFLLSNLYKMYKKLLFETNHCVIAHVNSAFQISLYDQEKIIDFINIKFKLNAILDIKIDKSLLSGFIIKINNFIIDNSILNRINIMKHILYKKIG